MILPTDLVKLMSTLFPRFPSKWTKDWKSVKINGYVTNTSKLYAVYLNPWYISEDIIKKAKLLGFNDTGYTLILYYHDPFDF